MDLMPKEKWVEFIIYNNFGLFVIAKYCCFRNVEQDVNDLVFSNDE